MFSGEAVQKSRADKRESERFSHEAGTDEELMAVGNDGAALTILGSLCPETDCSFSRIDRWMKQGMKRTKRLNREVLFAELIRHLGQLGGNELQNIEEKERNRSGVGGKQSGRITREGISTAMRS